MRQTRDRDGLEKEIERIKEQMGQMIQASAKIDVLADQKYPDGDGSEVAEELRRGGRYTRSAHTWWSRFSGS